MLTRIAIVAMLALMVGACAGPDAEPGSAYEKTAGYEADNSNDCDKDKLRINFAVIDALRHDPSIINAGGKIRQINQQKWSELPPNADGSVSCQTGVAILLSNSATVGGLVRVTYADQNALDAGHSTEVTFKPDDAILQQVLREQEAAREKQDQEDMSDGLTPMRAADFELDKHQLQTDKKIVLNGYYWRYQGVEVLTDQPPTRIRNDGVPKVGLVTNGAPQHTKDFMQLCNKNAGGWCRVTLIGHAGSCEYLLGGLPANADVCLYVDESRHQQLAESKAPGV